MAARRGATMTTGDLLVNETVQASGTAPTTQPTRIDIGSSPLTRWFWAFLVVGPGLVLVAFCLFSVGGAGVGIIVVVGALPWAIAMMAICIKLLSLLLTGGGLHYQRTKAAVRDGRIGISYYLRGAEDVIVVDEARRLICCNGDVFGFDDVKRLNWQSGNGQHRLDFTLSSGANPVRSADLGHEGPLRVAFERLGNTLGFG